MRKTWVPHHVLGTCDEKTALRIRVREKKGKGQKRERPIKRTRSWGKTALPRFKKRTWAKSGGGGEEERCGESQDFLGGTEQGGAKENESELRTMPRKGSDMVVSPGKTRRGRGLGRRETCSTPTSNQRPSGDEGQKKRLAKMAHKREPPAEVARWSTSTGKTKGGLNPALRNNQEKKGTNKGTFPARRQENRASGARRPQGRKKSGHRTHEVRRTRKKTRALQQPPVDRSLELYCPESEPAHQHTERGRIPLEFL